MKTNFVSNAMVVLGDKKYDDINMLILNKMFDIIIQKSTNIYNMKTIYNINNTEFNLMCNLMNKYHLTDLFLGCVKEYYHEDINFIHCIIEIYNDEIYN